MNCKRAHRLLDRYLDGELAHKAALQVEEHVKGCTQCGNYLKSARSIGQAIKASALVTRAETALSDRAWAHVKAGIESRERLSPGSRLLAWWRWLTFYPRPVWASAFAAAALVVALVTTNTARHQSTKLAHPVVEYVESQSSQVMVFMPEQSPITVIWFFEKAKAQGG